MDAKQFESIIKLKEARVAVFGLGYVGLPLAVEIAKSGFTTIGADIDPKKLELLSAGINPLSDMTLDQLFPRLVEKKIISFDSPENAAQKSDIKIICVPTPSRNKSPDLTHVRSVAKYIGKHVKRGDLIINESTVGPGMTRKILCSVLESESGLTAGTDFFVVASPERIDPGNPISLLDIPKVVGGITEESTRLAVLFYSSFIKKVVPVSSLDTAEMVKMLENSFRALNIGFANELAKFCDEVGIDIKEVIDAAATKPYGFMPHYPGIAVKRAYDVSGY
ncbi:MAG: nucleotide sugar dehydrogenase, partial [Nanoarchaeota archaeon]